MKNVADTLVSRLIRLPEVLSDCVLVEWRKLLLTSSDAKPSDLRSGNSRHLPTSPSMRSEVLATAIICAALVVYVSGFLHPGKALAGPGDSGRRDMVEDAIHDMRWREKMEQPRRPASSQSVPVAQPRPPVQQPDLSGLPKQLPQAVSPMPQPVDASPATPLAKPKLDDPSPEKPKLIKPKIGKASDREPEPKARKRTAEPARPPVRVQSTPYPAPVQAAPQNVRQPAPVAVPQQATAPKTQPLAPLSQPDEIIDRRTGLIKPRLRSSNGEKPRLAPRTPGRQEAQLPVSRTPSAYQQPTVQTQGPGQPVQR